MGFGGFPITTSPDSFDKRTFSIPTFMGFLWLSDPIDGISVRFGVFHLHPHPVYGKRTFSIPTFMGFLCLSDAIFGSECPKSVGISTWIHRDFGVLGI